MGHFKNTEHRSGTTSREWLRVGSQISELANIWAGRFDLVSYVGPGAGGDHPACYIPSLSEIEVNVEIAFGKGTTPEMIGDLTKKSTQYAYAKGVGAVLHEAFHARFSKWSDNMEKVSKEMTPEEFKVLILLEESRIESFGLITNPDSILLLRSCIMEIVLKDVKEIFATSSDIESASALVALVNARVTTGVLKYSEVEELYLLVQEFLGYELVEKLEDIARRFQSHSIHSDLSAVYPLLTEWVELLKGAENDEEGEPEKDKTSSGASPDFLEKMLDALEEVAGTVAVSINDEISDAEEQEEWKEVVDNRSKTAKDQKRNEEIASEVFSKSTGPADSKTSSRLLNERRATADERRASVKISQMLERAKYRERDAVEIKSSLPPGRLRTRALVQGTAMKSKGVMTPIEPWQRTVRKHTDDPTLTVGVMVDISGSMSGAMEPMATTAWVMSEAVRRVQGKCAMVYYGNDVFATLKPGEHLESVRVYSAQDGTEVFGKGFKALDGSLNLLNGRGARLLVIVSDGEYVGQEQKEVQRALDSCNKNGVAVLWIPFGNSSTARLLCSNSKAIVLGGILEPAQASTEIGKACATALTNASR
jgi:hypothetical protein